MNTGMISRALAVFSFIFLGGCAAGVAFLPVALPAIISGAGMGINYTFTNIAYKTMTYPADDVLSANLKALDKMSLEVLKVKRKKHGYMIKSRTRKHKIYITIERMTPTLTRMTVNAKRLLFFKDKTTAFEVIYQTERFLIGLNNSPGEAKQKETAL